MQLVRLRCLPGLIGVILLLSFAALLINYFSYKFPGNDFFPPDTLILAVILFIIYLGLVLTFGKQSQYSYTGLEVIYFFGVMSLVALATNAVQLTPFPTIDQQIVHLESHLNIHMVSLMAWTNKHPIFKNMLAISYDTLPYQMSILPLLIIAMRRFSLIREYYFLLLCTTLLGFIFYYFYPTTAPASILNSKLFAPEQIATGLKFNQIHHHIVPSTNEGGLIAMPSFHTIWALLCLYLLKEWPIPFLFLLTINILLILACVLLGWHYPTDLLGAFIITALSYGFLIYCKSSNFHFKTTNEW